MTGLKRATAHAPGIRRAIIGGVHDAHGTVINNNSARRRSLPYRSAKVSECRQMAIGQLAHGQFLQPGAAELGVHFLRRERRPQ
jgi:hypothetical protein